MWSLDLGKYNQNDTYGLLIIGISIVSRIFVVSIAWSYGIFLVALKNSFPDSYFVELGWIAGLAQGLGSILAPVFNYVSLRFGVKPTFFVGMLLCFVSLLLSSFVNSEHLLFLTYSIPFGMGSAIIFVLGSLLTGSYFPPSHKYHVTASVAIGLGFPMGFLILNPLTDSLMSYNNDWRYVQRIYSGVTFIILVICCPLFSEKHVSQQSIQTHSINTKVFQKSIHFLDPKTVKYLVMICWYAAIFFTSSANNSILIHLNGFFVSLGLSVPSAATAFVFLGIADAIYRIILAAFGPRLVNKLVYCYMIAAFIGMILSIMWSNQTGPTANMIYCILFGFCPAVSMSLMYSINSEITGPDTLQKSYTLNVMVSGIGLIVGPILSGLLLDNSNKNYEQVFTMATVFYLVSLLLISFMKFLLILNNRVNGTDGLDQGPSEYVEFDNES